MFTQCSKCETVYRLSADTLRAAAGQVRCGRCGEVFNALSRLAEDSAGFSKGESPLSLETRAEEILESSASDLTEDPADEPTDGGTGEGVEDFDLPPGVEHAQLHFIGIVDDDLAAETSLEFTLPPGELDRIFIENRMNPLDQLTSAVPPHPESLRLLVDDTPKPKSVPTPPVNAPTPPVNAPAGTSTPPKLVATPPAKTSAPPRPAPVALKAVPAPPQAVPAPPEGIPAAPKRVPVPPKPDGAPPLTRVSGLEVSDDVRQEVLASLRVVGPARNDATSRSRRPFAAWLTAAILLGILLMVQLIRGNRDWVAAHLPWLVDAGPTAANLSVYQLRQWGVTGDPGANGTLRVRASIMNTASELKPYPLLRVSLVNRFGSRIGAREFQPAEYLGHGIARMLAPGERVDATLDILDPGKDAEGFEIDVCLRTAEEKVVCAGDAAAHAK